VRLVFTCFIVYVRASGMEVGLWLAQLDLGPTVWVRGRLVFSILVFGFRFRLAGDSDVEQHGPYTGVSKVYSMYVAWVGTNRKN
jgi:hypothetical protein